MLAELDAWGADGDEASSAWLIYAEGGVGKTRLAIEWARRRRARGWCAEVFLPMKPIEVWAGDLCACGVHVLVVIDYAESRPDLTALLNELRAAHSTSAEADLRVLLLAATTAIGSARCWNAGMNWGLGSSNGAHEN